MITRNIYIILFTLLSLLGFGQTSLSEGDMAIIGMDTPGEDFSFVCFVDIVASTEIYFTDEEADGDYTIGTGEGTVLFTAPAGGISKGTVITYVGNSSYFSTTSDGNMALSNSGDGLIAYQGSSAGNVTTFLHAIGEDAGDLGSFPGGFSNYMTFGADDGEYNGTRTGTAAALMSAINDNSNWTTSGSGVIPFNTTAFTISGAASGPSITSISHTPAIPTSSQTVSVTADVADADGVFGVELHWGTSSGSLGTTISMSNTGGNTYETVTDIPAQSNGTTVYYEVYAMDNNTDDNTSAEYNYTVTNPSTTVTIHEDDFVNCGSTQWIEESVSSNKDWTCGSGVFEINAYGGTAAAEDYLISPEINLDNYTDEELSFQSWTQYSDSYYPAVELLYTTNYTGNPSTTTWNSSLSATFSAQNSQVWTSSGIIDISGISGTAVRFAFKYTSSGTGGGSSSYWKIDDILIEGENAPTAGISLSMADDGDLTEGNEDAEQIDVKVLGDTLAATLTLSNWTFSNLPSGVSVASVSRVNDSIARLTLSGNATSDYDSDITNFSVEISHSEFKNLSSGSETIATGVTFVATNDAESITMADDGAIYEGAENGEVITVTLVGGNFVNPLTLGNWSISNQPTGVSIGSVNRVSSTSVEVTLSGNASADYNSDITNAEIAIDANEIEDHVGSDITTNTGVTFIATSLSMVDDGAINEANENGEVITISLSGDNFVGSLNIANWTFTNLPTGVNATNLTRNSNTEAQITLSGNASVDYDNNITNFTIEIGHAEFVNLASGSQTINTGVVFIANDDAESITMADDGSITEGSEDGEIIQVQLSGGNFVSSLNSSNWQLSGAPVGVSISSLSWVNDSIVQITLAGNASTDYDSDITDAELIIDADEIDDLSSGTLSVDSGITFTALIEPKPTVQSTNIVFASVGADDMDIEWTRGDGDYCLVIASEDAPISAYPVDTVDYSFSNIFGNGDDLGSGNYAVYRGSSNSFTLDGLGQGKTYYIRVFEFNNSGTNTKYDTTAATGNPAHSSTKPNNVDNFSLDCISKSSAHLSWTLPSGNYSGIIIAARESTNPVHTISSGQGDTIAASSVFGNGYEFGSTTPHSFVVYNGTGTSVTVSGLTSGAEYTFKAYVYQDSLWSSGTTKSAQKAEIKEVTNLSFYGPNKSLVLNWDNPSFNCPDEVMVVMRETSPISAVPSGDGSSYTSSSVFGSGTDMGTGEYVVYKGQADGVTVSGLTNGTEYHFKIFVRDDATWSDGIYDSIIPNDITILFSGDLAVLAVNTNNASSDDEISFVCFDTLKTGTAIDFTDNGWERSNTGYWGGTEGTIRIVRTGSDVPPGEVITIRGEGYQSSDFRVSIDTTDTDWSISSLNGNWNFNLNGTDQLWMMQYGIWTNGGTSHMASYSGNILYGWTATGWAGDPGHGSSGSTSYSALYPLSECFNTNVVNTTSNDKVKYTGDTTVCTQREWVARINDPDNWTGYSSNAGFDAGGYDFASGLQLSIAIATYSDGEWIGDADTNWFNCSNWSNLLVPDENTDVSITNNAVKTCIIDDQADFSDDYNDTATCKSLSISDSTLFFAHGTEVLTIYNDLNLTGGNLMLNGANLVLYGDWNNSSVTAFQGSNGTVYFMGDANQTLNNTAGAEFIDKVILDNAYHLNLNSDLEINSLDFDQGKLFLEDNELTVNDSITGYTNTSYVICEDDKSSNGVLTMKLQTSRLIFPIGNVGSYTPLRAQLGSGSAYFSTRVFTHIYEHGTSGSALSGDAVNKTWIFQPELSGAYAVDMKFTWNLADEMGSFSSDRSTASLIYNDLSAGGSQWSDWSIMSGGGPVLGTNPFTYNQTNISSFGAFSIGAKCSIRKPITSNIYHF